MKEIIIATTNVHKVQEIRSFFKKRLRSPLEIYSLIDFPNYQPPEETGSTFEENATLKALAAAQTLGKWSLADDSGLVVPSLQGAPGVYSARYAGAHATDLENRKKLLKEMSCFDEMQRFATMECYLVLASPTKVEKVCRGSCEGTIGHCEKGRNGFGYDPLFLKHGYNQTFAELDPLVKNQVSHRGKALEKLALTLERL